MKLLTDPNPDVLAQIYRTWAASLDDLPDVAIRMGMIRVRDFTGWLSVPTFRELCKVTAEDLGLSSAKNAYIEACNKQMPWERQSWSSAAVYRAAVETGRFQLHTLTEKECFPLFKANYETMCSRVMNGETLDVPVRKMLPESVPNPTPPEVAKAHLSRFKEML